MTKPIGILYTGVLILLILNGAQALVMRDIGADGSGVFYPGFFISLVIAFTHIKRTSKKQKLFFVVVMLSPFFTYNNIVDIIRDSALRIFPMASAILLLPDEAELIKKRILNFFGCLIFISLILYYLYLSSLVPTSSYLSEQYYGETILYLLCYSPAYAFKFCGFCVEPGYFSLLCVSLLCLDDYNFQRKLNIVLLVSVILSFSLGGYLLLILSWGIFFINKIKGMDVKRLFRGVLFIFVLFYFLADVPFAKDMFEEKIMDRMEFDSEKGISGNNRQNYMAEVYILDVVLSDRVFWGIGTPEYLSWTEQIENFDAASGLVFVVRYGLVYTMMLLVGVFLFSFYGQRSPQKMIPFFMVFMGDFIQHGLPFGGLFVLYVLSVIVSESNDVANNQDTVISE